MDEPGDAEIVFQMNTRDIGAMKPLASSRFQYDPAKLHALIVTPQVYRDPAISDLRTPIKDGETLARILIEDLGYPASNVTRLYQGDGVTWNGIDTALRNFIRNPLDEDASVLIYFAGHGKADDLTNEGYWLPSDAKAADSQTWYANDKLNKIIEHYRARHVAVISDSCYSGRLLREVAPRTFSPKLASYYHDVSQSRSRWALTSGGDRPVSDDGSAGHSIFCLRLTDYLKSGPGNLFTLTDAFSAIRDRIPGQAARYGPLKDEAHEHGELVFCRVNRIVDQTTREPVVENIKPEEVKVTEYEIDPVRIEIQIIGSDEQNRLSPSDLPAVPQEYWDLVSKIAGTREALDKIRQSKHPAFDPARSAVDEAQKQYSRIRSQTEKFCKHKVFQELKEIHYNRPEKTATELLELKPASMSRSEFTEGRKWIGKLREADLALNRVKHKLDGLRKQKRDQLNAELKLLEEKTLKTRNDFIGQIVISHLETLGLSEQPNFPDEPLIDLVPRIAQYPFELSEDEVWGLSEAAYENNAAEIKARSEEENRARKEHERDKQNRIASENAKREEARKKQELAAEIRAQQLSECAATIVPMLVIGGVLAFGNFWFAAAIVSIGVISSVAVVFFTSKNNHQDDVFGTGVAAGVVSAIIVGVILFLLVWIQEDSLKWPWPGSPAATPLWNSLIAFECSALYVWTIFLAGIACLIGLAFGESGAVWGFIIAVFWALGGLWLGTWAVGSIVFFGDLPSDFSTSDSIFSWGQGQWLVFVVGCLYWGIVEGWAVAGIVSGLRKSM